MSHCPTCSDRRYVGGFLPAPCPNCNACKGEPHTCDQERIAAAEGKTDRLIEENDSLRAQLADSLADCREAQAGLATYRSMCEEACKARDEARAECGRMRRVYELAKRWCNRPVSCLREGGTVLANDAEMFAKLHAALAAEKTEGK